MAPGGGAGGAALGVLGAGTGAGFRRVRSSRSTATAATITTSNPIKRYKPVPEVQENPPGGLVGLTSTVRTAVRVTDLPAKSRTLNESVKLPVVEYTWDAEEFPCE
jgi:hypothetical protein